MFDTIQFPADWVIRFDLRPKTLRFWVIKGKKEISVAYLEDGWEFFHSSMHDRQRVNSAKELIECLEREFKL